MVIDKPMVPCCNPSLDTFQEWTSPVAVQLQWLEVFNLKLSCGKSVVFVCIFQVEQLLGMRSAKLYLQRATLAALSSLTTLYLWAVSTMLSHPEHFWSQWCWRLNTAAELTVITCTALHLPDAPQRSHRTNFNIWEAERSLRGPLMVKSSSRTSHCVAS